MLENIASLPQIGIAEIAPMVAGTSAAMLWRGKVGRMKPLPFLGWSAAVTASATAAHFLIGLAHEAVPYLPTLGQGVVIAATCAALCRLGAARGHDAWGREDLGWISVVPVLNILPLFAPSAPRPKGAERPN